LREVFVNRLNGILSFLVISILSGCGSDNMSDALSRKKDIEREAAAQQTKDYEQIVGDYVSDPDESERDVTATFQVLRVRKDGSNVPQPTITGSFTIKQASKRALLPQQAEAPGSDIEAVIAFSNGVYDPASKDLAVQIAGVTTPGAYVSCKTKFDRIRCTWFPIASGERFCFTLVKKTQ
jgi:hypothetical protein